MILLQKVNGVPMSFEFLERKKKALDNAIAAFHAFQEALRELPSEWREEVLAELASLKSSGEGHNGKFPQQEDQHEEDAGEEEQDQETEEAVHERSRSPTVAVLNFLKKNSGAKPGHVAAMLEDFIYTKSKDPKTIIYTTISYLKNKGKIRQEADGRCYAND